MYLELLLLRVQSTSTTNSISTEHVLKMLTLFTISPCILRRNKAAILL